MVLSGLEGIYAVTIGVRSLTLLSERDAKGELLRLREFAERLGYSIHTVYKKIQRKQLERWLVAPAEGGHPLIDWTAYQRDMRKVTARTTTDLRRFRGTKALGFVAPLSLAPLSLAALAAVAMVTTGKIEHWHHLRQTQSIMHKSAEPMPWHKHQFIYRA